jgi:hypothetical protein
MSSDKINRQDANRIYEDAKIAMENLSAIVTECTTGEYVSKRYLREKLGNVEYAVNFIKAVIEE